MIALDLLNAIDKLYTKFDYLERRDADEGWLIMYNDLVYKDIYWGQIEVSLSYVSIKPSPHHTKNLNEIKEILNKCKHKEIKICGYEPKYLRFNKWSGNILLINWKDDDNDNYIYQKI